MADYDYEAEKLKNTLEREAMPAPRKPAPVVASTELRDRARAFADSQMGRTLATGVFAGVPLSEDPEKRKLQLEGMSPSGMFTNPARAAERLGLISKGVEPPPNAPEGTGQEKGPEDFQPAGSPLTPADPRFGAGGAGGSGSVIDHPVSIQQTRELGHDTTQAKGHYEAAAKYLGEAARLEEVATRTQSDQERAFFEAQDRNKQALLRDQNARESARQAEMQAFQKKVADARVEASSPRSVLGHAVGDFISGIGIAMGAWAAVRSKGPNHALAAYNALTEKQLQRLKMEAQETENYFSRMKAQFGDERQAELATRLALDDIAKGQLAKIGAQARSDHAQATLQQARASIEAQQGGLALDMQKIEDGKSVQSTTVNQPYQIKPDGAHAIPLLDRQGAPEGPPGQPGQPGPSLPAPAPGAKGPSPLALRDAPWLVDDKALSAEVQKLGPVQDTGPAAVRQVGGRKVIVQPPGALVAKPEEARKGAIDAQREPLTGEALLRWRVANDPWRTKNGDTNDPQEKGKLTYEDWLKVEKNPRLMHYMLQAPKVTQALESTSIGDAKWMAFNFARNKGLGEVFLRTACTDAERADINKLVVAESTFKALQGGKALNAMEGANLAGMYGGTGSLSDMRRAVRDSYAQKAAEWNASVGGMKRTALLTLYDNARHGGPPVWAQPWDNLHVKTTKAK
jgi:hypothetical protein